MIRKIIAPDFKVTQEKKLSHLSGALVWLIFYPTGAKLLHHRHILTLNNKASSVAGLCLVAEDGVVEQVFRGENFSDHLGWDQVKKFIEFRKLGHWPNAV